MDEELKQFQNRKTRVEALLLLGALTLVIAALLFVFEGPFILIVGSIIVGSITVFFGFSSYVSIQDDFKDNVLKDILEGSVQNGYYDPRQGLGESQVYQSEAFKQADFFNSEDFLSGAIDGVSFVSSDVVLMHLEKVSTTAKNDATSYTPYFKGRVFSFEFNKTFDGALQLREYGLPATQRPYSKLSFDSKPFSKLFTLYTTKIKTANNLLTKPLQEALLKLEKNHPEKLTFSFVESKFYVAINDFQKTFKLRMFRPLNKEALEAFNDDLLILGDIVHTLKLNRNIFERDTIDFAQIESYDA